MAEVADDFCCWRSWRLAIKAECPLMVAEVTMGPWGPAWVTVVLKITSEF